MQLHTLLDILPTPPGIHSASCTAQKQGSESRCKAPNEAKYPGMGEGEPGSCILKLTWASLGTKSPSVGEEWRSYYAASQVNLKLHIICGGVLSVVVFCFFKRFLLAAVRGLIYRQSVFHLSFPPSLPYPFLKDCSGEYTGSIKLFWPEIPLLINHLQGPLISAATPQRKAAYSGVCCWAGPRLL